MQAAIRLLPYAAADGPHNMAADEALLRSAADGIASLRTYGWTSATVSLGYFQSAAVRLADPRLAALPWVRRPSGGATLVHHHELTYALALPHASPYRQSGPWLPRMHAIIARALAELGIRHGIEAAAGAPVKHGDVLCFQQFTAGDLLCLGNKVAGSAQRKYRQALLQHGSILLAQSEFAPDLPGIQELTGIRVSIAQMGEALVDVFSRETGWRLGVSDWTDAERSDSADLVQKYGSPSWNERR